MLAHILLQVLTAIHQRIARIDNLHNEVTPLEHAPQLAPHLQIFLEGRQHCSTTSADTTVCLVPAAAATSSITVSLFDNRESAPPLEEGRLLAGIEFCGRHFSRPWWSSRKSENIRYVFLVVVCVVLFSLLRLSTAVDIILIIIVVIVVIAPVASRVIACASCVCCDESIRIRLDTIRE